MTIRLFEIPNTEYGEVAAKEVSAVLQRLVKSFGVTKRELAGGLGLSESFLNRMLKRTKGTYKAGTLRPIRRAAKLLSEAENTLTAEGVGIWLKRPNPFLNDLPPVLCMRSDAELERPLAQLQSIRHGFPA